MNWIYDQRTPHSRLMVAYDMYGLTMREWSDDCEDTGFHYHEAFYTWKQFRERERSYSGDDGSGRLKMRLVAGCISLMGHFGPDSSTCGTVASLGDYINGSHMFQC